MAASSGTEDCSGGKLSVQQAVMITLNTSPLVFFLAFPRNIFKNIIKFRLFCRAAISAFSERKKDSYVLQSTFEVNGVICGE